MGLLARVSLFGAGWGYNIISWWVTKYIPACAGSEGGHGAVDLLPHQRTGDRAGAGGAAAVPLWHACMYVDGWRLLIHAARAPDPCPFALVAAQDVRERHACMCAACDVHLLSWTAPCRAFCLRGVCKSMGGDAMSMHDAPTITADGVRSTVCCAAV